MLMIGMGHAARNFLPPCLQVVFTGLDMVIPLMTAELLQFPKLARAFFALLSFTMEVYPERVAALPGTPCSARFCSP